MYGLRNRLTRDNTGRDAFDWRRVSRIDWTFAVDCLAEGIHHTAEQAGADWDLEDTAGTFDRVPFNDVLVVPEHHRAHRILFQVQCQAKGIVGKLQHLALHRISESVNPADAVGQTDDGAFGTRLSTSIKILNPFLDQFTDFGGVQLHRHSLIPLAALLA